MEGTGQKNRKKTLFGQDKSDLISGVTLYTEMFYPYIRKCKIMLFKHFLEINLASLKNWSLTSKNDNIHVFINTFFKK